MKGFKDHINLIENYIGELLKGLNDNTVYDPVKYFLKLPSKRVRPLLTIISSSLYNNDNEYSLPAAISNEIFHNQNKCIKNIFALFVHTSMCINAWLYGSCIRGCI